MSGHGKEEKKWEKGALNVIAKSFVITSRVPLTLPFADWLVKAVLSGFQALTTKNLW